MIVSTFALPKELSKTYLNTCCLLRTVTLHQRQIQRGVSFADVKLETQIKAGINFGLFMFSDLL